MSFLHAYRRLEVYGVPCFQCGHCKLWKARDAFKRDRGDRYGIENRCRACRGRKGARTGRGARSLGSGGLLGRMKEILNAP